LIPPPPDATADIPPGLEDEKVGVAWTTLAPEAPPEVDDDVGVLLPARFTLARAVTPKLGLLVFPFLAPSLLLVLLLMLSLVSMRAKTRRFSIFASSKWSAEVQETK
jgi:hypothetical protein